MAKNPENLKWGRGKCIVASQSKWNESSMQWALSNLKSTATIREFECDMTKLNGANWMWKSSFV